MAFKSLTGFDSAGNEALNMRLQNLAIAPATPLDGFVYYNTTSLTAQLYTIGGWITLGHIGEVLTTLLLEKLNGITAFATAVADSTTNGNILINGVQNVVYTHPTGTNPHGTTKSDVGLGNVENKSVATILSELTAAQIALSLGFAPKNVIIGTSLPASTGSGNLFVKSDTQDFYADKTGGWVFLGTGRVASTTNSGLMSGADKTKIDASYTSAQTDTAISTAINNLVSGAPGLLDTLHELATALGDDPNFAATMTANLNNKVDKVAGKQLSTEDFTAALLTKLNGIATGANNYVHPTGDGNSHVPVTGTTNANKVLKAGATANSAAWGFVGWAELTGVPTNLTKKYAVAIGDGTATSIVVTHNLNTRDVQVGFVEAATPWNAVVTDWQATSVNTITVLFATAPTVGQYRVTVTG